MDKAIIIDTNVVNGIKVCTVKDYDGYFTRVAERMASKLTNPKIKIILVYSYPMLPFDVKYSMSEGGVLKLIWYSAVRAGFGSTHEDELIEELNNM